MEGQGRWEGEGKKKCEREGRGKGSERMEWELGRSIRGNGNTKGG